MPLTLTPARIAGRLVAAATLAAAAGLAVPLAPASAAACPAGDGVTVVVEFGNAGGGTVTSCVPDGGGNSAAEQFGDAGHSLERVQRFPGAVCKVDGKPGSASCVNMPPTSAYWALYWKKAGGGWAYSSEGVDSLDIPDGGGVRFTWKGSADAPDDPEPSDGGNDGGNGGGNGGGSGGATPDESTSTPSDTAPPSVAPEAEKSAAPADPGKADEDEKQGKKQDGNGSKKQKDKADRPTDEPTATPEATATADDTQPTSAEAPADAGDDGLPLWVAPVGIAVLFVAAGATALVRRRSAT